LAPHDHGAGAGEGAEEMRVLLVACALALLASPAVAKKADGKPRAERKTNGRLEKTEDKVAGGTHWRIKTSAGAVHVWIPPNYDRTTAGTVVYVHGYWTDADGAWRDYKLAQQFRA